MHPTRAVCVALATLALGACTTARPPAVPAAIAVPEGATFYLELAASGVQIYKCNRKTDGSFEWAFQAPEATLSTTKGVAAGKHYGGPTWEAPDGSAVVGEVKARDPGPTPGAIPWLLLAAKSTRGSGAFGTTSFIQRIDTVGGIAPGSACADANLGAVARVPYTANYLFYRQAGAGR